MCCGLWPFSFSTRSANNRSRRVCPVVMSVMTSTSSGDIWRKCSFSFCVTFAFRDLPAFFFAGGSDPAPPAAARFNFLGAISTNGREAHTQNCTRSSKKSQNGCEHVELLHCSMCCCTRKIQNLTCTSPRFHLLSYRCNSHEYKMTKNGMKTPTHAIFVGQMFYFFRMAPRGRGSHIHPPTLPCILKLGAVTNLVLKIPVP